MNSTKVCRDCGLEKPIGEFSKRSRSSDGLNYYCKECHKARCKEWLSDNQAHVIAYRRTYRATHHAQLQQELRTFRQKNPEAWKRSQKRYKRTPKGWAQKTWTAMNQRTTNGKYPNPKNRSDRQYLAKPMADGTIGVRIDIIWEEFLEFVHQHFHICKALWAAGETPSIDRIDPRYHYSSNNLQIVSMRENSRKVQSDARTSDRSSETKPTSHISVQDGGSDQGAPDCRVVC